MRGNCLYEIAFSGAGSTSGEIVLGFSRILQFFGLVLTIVTSKIDVLFEQ